MRHTLLIITMMLLTGCATTKPDKEKTDRGLILFQDANFGVHFSHTDALTAKYNPHGGANIVVINRNDEPIGGLLIHRLPPIDSEDEFISSGKAYYMKTHQAASVDYLRYENPHKCRIHNFKVRMQRNGADYVLERFVYFHRTKDDRPEMALLGEMFGTFSFEFLLPEKDYERLKDELLTVVNTFRIVRVH